MFVILVHSMEDIFELVTLLLTYLLAHIVFSPICELFTKTLVILLNGILIILLLLIESFIILEPSILLSKILEPFILIILLSLIQLSIKLLVPTLFKAILVLVIL